MVKMALSKSFVKLKRIVQCAICLEVFDEPVTLRCFHSFCSKCIKGMKTQLWHGKQVYSCPLCRSFTAKDDLKEVFLMKDLLEVFRLVHGERTSCSKCNNQQQKWHCLQCKSSCCEECKQDHNFIPALKHHEWVSFDDIKELMKEDKVIYCEKHPDEVLELECEQCGELICYLCKAINHQRHRTGPIKRALQRLIPIIQEKQDKTKVNISTVTSSIEKIQEEKKDAENWYEKLQKHLDQQKNVVIQKLNTDHEMLCKKISELKSKEVSQYDSAIRKLECSVKEEQSLVQWTDHILTTGSGTSLLQVLTSDLQEQLTVTAATVRHVRINKPTYPEYRAFDVNNTNLLGRLDDGEAESKVEIRVIKDDYNCKDAVVAAGERDVSPNDTKELRSLRSGMMGSNEKSIKANRESIPEAKSNKFLLSAHSVLVKPTGPIPTEMQELSFMFPKDQSCLSEYNKYTKRFQKSRKKWKKRKEWKEREDEQEIANICFYFIVFISISIFFTKITFNI